MKNSLRQRAKLLLKKVRDFISITLKIIKVILLLLLKFTLAYTYIIVVSVGGIFLFFNSFLSRSVDTTLFTNIGFGLFAVTANICFSWSRTFSNVQAEIAAKISFQGERLLLSSLCFLVASLLKYLYLQVAHTPVAGYGGLLNMFLWFVYCVFFASFLYAYMMATAGVYELFVLLFGRHIKPINLDFGATNKQV
jgi:hypothetical protein